MFRSKLGRKPLGTGYKSHHRIGASKFKSFGTGHVGQTQVMATPQAPVVVQQTTPKANQQQHSQSQHQLTNIKFTQEDLQRDLETLARQQRESKQRLEEAKKAKQRASERHAAVEAKLGELKYQVGQDRTELQRRQKLFTEGKHLLDEARAARDSAGEDLSELDRKFKMALVTKQYIKILQRQHNRVQEQRRGDLKEFQELIEKTSKQIKDAEKEIQARKDRQEAIRVKVQDEIKRANIIEREIVKIQYKMTDMDREVTSIGVENGNLRAEIDNIYRQRDVDDKRHQQKVADFHAKLKEQDLVKKKAEAESKSLRANAAEKKKALHKVWNEVIDLQTKSGFEPIPGPTESETPAPILLKPFENKRDLEVKAKKDELKAAEDLEANNKSLEATLTACMQNVGEAKKNADIGQEKLKDLQEAEKKRTEVIEKGKTENEALQKQVNQERKSQKARRKELDHRVEQTKVEMAALQEKQNEVDTYIANLDSQIKEVLAQTTEIKSKSEQRKKDEEQKRQDLTKTIETTRLKNKELKADIAQTKKSSRTNGTSGNGFESIKEEISAILEEHPDLEDIPYSYRPELSVDEQAKDSLAQLIRDCDRKISSAKKMKVELQEAKEQQAEERRQMEAAAKEERRQKKARETRKDRLVPKRTSKWHDSEDELSILEHKSKKGKSIREANNSSKVAKSFAVDKDEKAKAVQDRKRKKSKARKDQTKRTLGFHDHEDSTEFALDSTSKEGRSVEKRKIRGRKTDSDCGSPFNTENPSVAKEAATIDTGTGRPLMLLEFESAAKPRSLLASFDEPTDNDSDIADENLSPTLFTSSDKKVTWKLDPEQKPDLIIDDSDSEIEMQARIDAVLTKKNSHETKKLEKSASKLSTKAKPKKKPGKSSEQTRVLEDEVRETETIELSTVSSVRQSSLKLVDYHKADHRERITDAKPRKSSSKRGIHLSDKKDESKSKKKSKRDHSTSARDVKSNLKQVKSRDEYRKEKVPKSNSERRSSSRDSEKPSSREHHRAHDGTEAKSKSHEESYSTSKSSKISRKSSSRHTSKSSKDGSRKDHYNVVENDADRRADSSRERSRSHEARSSKKHNSAKKSSGTDKVRSNKHPKVPGSNQASDKSGSGRHFTIGNAKKSIKEKTKRHSGGHSSTAKSIPGKKRSSQKSELLSTERPSKVRRRSKPKPTSSAKAQLQSFGDEGFSFGF